MKTEIIKPYQKNVKLTALEKFSEINRKLNLGKVGGHNCFRSHMLRKVHASLLHKEGMSIDIINELQGRSKKSANDSYFFEDPLFLKEQYIKYMNPLIIDKL